MSAPPIFFKTPRDLINPDKIGRKVTIHVAYPQGPFKISGYLASICTNRRSVVCVIAATRNGVRHELEIAFDRATTEFMMAMLSLVDDDDRPPAVYGPSTVLTAWDATPAELKAGLTECRGGGR